MHIQKLIPFICPTNIILYEREKREGGSGVWKLTNTLFFDYFSFSLGDCILQQQQKLFILCPSPPVSSCHEKAKTNHT